MDEVVKAVVIGILTVVIAALNSDSKEYPGYGAK